MATTKNITMKQFNGTDYDTLYPKTKIEQVEGAYTQQQILADSTKTLYGLRSDATPNDVFTKLAMPHGYYGFDVTTVFSDGTPVPFVILNGLQDISGNAAITDENGRCPVAMIDNKTPTVTVSNYIGIANTEVTITAEDKVIFTPVTITLERDTSVHLIQSSQTLRVLTGAPVDMCIVGGGAGGRCNVNDTSIQNRPYAGGGGGYAKNILGVTLATPKIVVAIGAGGSVNNAGGTTSIQYNGQTESISGGTSDIGNGHGGYRGAGSAGTVRVFEDETLPLPGGGGGGGGYPGSSATPNAPYAGGADFGGAGAVYNATVGETGKGPGGGGGGGYCEAGKIYNKLGGAGASGGLYIRVNAPEVSV